MTAGLGSTTALKPSPGHLTALRCVEPLQLQPGSSNILTNKRYQLTGRFDPELIEALPKSLRYISHNGAGYDQIDVGACSLKGPARQPPTIPTT